MEKISIITPCYNGQDYLDRYFKSVLSQTYPNLELIFINDGSTDRTEEIVDSYRSRLEEQGIAFIYLYQENAGQAAALNRGLKLFTGTYLTWPDADDEMSPDCIEKKVKYLDEHADISICVCKGVSVTDDEQKRQVGVLERTPPKGKDTLFTDLIYTRNCFFVPGGYMVRTADLDQAIPGRDIYAGRGGQNAQIILPLSYNGKVGYLEDILFTYYIRPNSHSHDSVNAEKRVKQQVEYETIVLETLRRMGEDVTEEYSPDVRKHFSGTQFGNAVDTQNPALVKKYFKKLRKWGKPTFHQWLVYLKYGYFLKSLER